MNASIGRKSKVFKISHDVNLFTNDNGQFKSIFLQSIIFDDYLKLSGVYWQIIGKS